MAEQVDADHLESGVVEQGGETVALPRRGERASPTVDEHHRDGRSGHRADRLRRSLLSPERQHEDPLARAATSVRRIVEEPR